MTLKRMNKEQFNYDIKVQIHNRTMDIKKIENKLLKLQTNENLNKKRIQHLRALKDSLTLRNANLSIPVYNSGELPRLQTSPRSDPYKNFNYS